MERDHPPVLREEPFDRLRPTNPVHPVTKAVFMRAPIGCVGVTPLTAKTAMARRDYAMKFRASLFKANLAAQWDA